MLEGTDAITNEVLEQTTFVLAYPTEIFRKIIAVYLLDASVNIRLEEVKILHTHSCKIQNIQIKFNPLNAELNPTCYSLILLEDLTFMGA
jgi:hypothetical protein